MAITTNKSLTLQQYYWFKLETFFLKISHEPLMHHVF